MLEFFRFILACGIGLRTAEDPQNRFSIMIFNYESLSIYLENATEFNYSTPCICGPVSAQVEREGSCPPICNCLCAERSHNVHSTKRRNSNNLTPQSGKIDLLSQMFEPLRDFARFAGINLSDDLLAEIEGIVALFVCVQNTSNVMGALSSIFLYIRRYYDKSVCTQAISYINDLFEVTPQSGFEVEEVPEWLKMMRNIRDNWSLCKDNQFFGHVSKMLGLLVCLGLCRVSDVTFSIKEFKVFEPDMAVIHGDAFNVLDAVFGTITFFVEGMYASFKAGSLKPLILSSHASLEIDEEFSRVTMWWELVKNGNLQRVEGVCDNEFDKRLETLATRLKNMLSTKLGTFEKRMIQDKFTRLLRIKNDFVVLKISSGVRKSPFAIELFGKSNQGKTTYGDQILEALLRSANLPTGNEHRATYNASDKFMSNWKTSNVVLTIDDMANDKARFVERPPTRVIVDVCNNQPFYANMADLDSKGKVFVEPAIVLVNTNVKTLDAKVYSNCPYSIQRRMHAVITVTAKKEFCLLVDGESQGVDSTKIREFHRKNGYEPTFDDIWVLTVERARDPGELHLEADYVPIEFRGKKLVNCDFGTVIQYLIEAFHEHNDSQNFILESKRKRGKNVTICDVDGCRQIRGYCDLHDKLEKQFGYEFGDKILDSGYQAYDIVSRRVCGDMYGSSTAVEGVVSMALLTAAKRFAKHWDWMTMVPTPWLNNPKFVKALAICDYTKLKRRYVARSCLMWTTCLAAMGLSVKKLDRSASAPISVALFSACFTRQKAMADIVQKGYRKELLHRNTISPMMKELRDKHVEGICKSIAIVGALYTMARVYRRWTAMNEQGSLEPRTQEEVDARDSEVNPWTSVVTRPLPFAEKSKCTTAERLANTVQKNMVYGSVVINSERVLMVNGLFVKSNVVVIPSHYFEVDTLDVTFRKSNPNAAGGKFATRLSRKSSYRIPNTDLMVCYSANGGSFKDLTEWFPLDNLPEHHFTMLWRAKDGNLKEAVGLADPKLTSNGVCDFVGGEYKNLSINTFRGLCGAVMISHGSGSSISGLHLGGKENTPRGCYGVITQNMLRDACENLRKCEGTLLTGTAEKFEPHILGVTVLTGQELHPKSPLNYMPENSQIEYYGSCVGMTTSRSDVKVTLISEHVMDVTGQPNIWRAPKMFPQWYGWQTCLENMAVPALPYSHELLDLCVRDYKSALIPIFKLNLWKHSKPLTDHENLCGIPGKKFMDAIKLNTSIGYPLTGEKRRFVTELEPTEERPNNRELDDVIMVEIKRCEDCYRRGERAFTIAKACKKDEVLAKEKCRIFYGNPIALTWLIRKYFLPILRVMQMNPLDAECAVGINCHGPEWQEMYNHVTKFGEHRLLGGDYGKYDQKLPSQLIIAALRIMIDFASLCDYSKDDLAIMEAMAGDIVYSLIAFNGDLIGLTEGTHISGNSLTVVINGICGSLNQRAYFYSKYPAKDFDSRTPFREVVSLITYGDDNGGSVREGFNDFTIKGLSEFLKSYGQTYTMPDKTSELRDFLPIEDFEFLKRANKYCPEKDCMVGALQESSIFKMLHCYLRPKGCVDSEQLACAKNIDTALREWSSHGREVYEKRRKEMSNVAEKSGLKPLCTQLDVTYEEIVDRWHEKYSKDYKLYDTVLEDFGDL